MLTAYENHICTNWVIKADDRVNHILTVMKKLTNHASISEILRNISYKSKIFQTFAKNGIFLHVANSDFPEKSKLAGVILNKMMIIELLACYQVFVKFMWPSYINSDWAIEGIFWEYQFDCRKCLIGRQYLVNFKEKWRIILILISKGTLGALPKIQNAIAEIMNM